MEQTIYRLQDLSVDRTFDTIQEKSTGEEQAAIENTVGGQLARVQVVQVQVGWCPECCYSKQLMELKCSIEVFYTAI